MKKQVKLYFWFVLALVLGVSLGGCASKFENISPPDNFLQQKNASIGLIWETNYHLQYPVGPELTAKHHMLGQQGLLDIAVARSFSDKLSTVLSTVKIKDLMSKHYLNVFQGAFANNNFNVKIKTEPYCSKNEYCKNVLDAKDLKAMIISDSVFEMPFFAVSYDYKPVIAEFGVDYLLVIDLSIHGTGRSYYGMLPTSPPKGFTELRSYLINGRTEKVISQHVSSVVEPVKREWDEPPKNAHLMKASEASFEIAINEVFIDIFKQAP